MKDVTTGAEIIVIRTAEKSIKSVTFLADGRHIVSTSSDGSKRLWDISSIPKGNLFQVACAWLPDHDPTDIARDYGLTNLQPICESDPPLPDALPR